MVKCSLYGIVAIVVLGSWAQAKPAAKGYWCFTLGQGGSESSACVRSRDKCTSAAEAARRLGAGACSFLETAWSTVTKQGGKSETYLFATRAHCEQHRDGMGGTACKEVK